MSVIRSFVAIAAVAAIGAACGSGGEGEPEPVDQADAGTGYPEPRDDLVPAVGTAGAVDLATWNIENFPKGVSTIAFTADLVHSMQLDLVAVQEIADVAAFDELVARLPDHDGILSSHTYGDGSYQKVGYLYRSSILRLEAPTLLFENMGYAFPRPPLQVVVHIDDGLHPPVRFVAITVHLKAGFDGDDRDRRVEAMAALADHVAGVVAGGEDEVVVLGDYNEVLTSGGGRQAMAPWLDDAGYVVHTDRLAQAGEFSFLPFENVLDHVVTTTGLSDELAGAGAEIPRIDQQTFNYETAVSDHLPVIIAMPILQ